MMAIKRIALLAFPRLTFLDLIGAYDSIRRVATMGIDAEVTHRIIGTEADIVDDSAWPCGPTPSMRISRAMACSTSRAASAPVPSPAYLVESFWGVEARVTIGAQMEYRG